MQESEARIGSLLSELYQIHASYHIQSLADSRQLLSLLTPCLASRRRQIALRACACIADIGVRLSRSTEGSNDSWELFKAWLLGSNAGSPIPDLEQQGLASVLCCFSIHSTLGRKDCIRLLLWGCSHVTKEALFRSLLLPIMETGREQMSPGLPQAEQPPGLRELELAALFSQLLRSLCVHSTNSLHSLLEYAQEAIPASLDDMLSLAGVLLAGSRGTVEHGAHSLLLAIRRRDTWEALKRAMLSVCKAIRSGLRGHGNGASPKTEQYGEPAPSAKWDKSAICVSAERSGAALGFVEWMMRVGDPIMSHTHAAGKAKRAGTPADMDRLQQASARTHMCLQLALAEICGWGIPSNTRAAASHAMLRRPKLDAPHHEILHATRSGAAHVLAAWIHGAISKELAAGVASPTSSHGTDSSNTFMSGIATVLGHALSNARQCDSRSRTSLAAAAAGKRGSSSPGSRSSLYAREPAHQLLARIATRHWEEIPARTAFVRVVDPFVRSVEGLVTAGRARFWPHTSSPLARADLPILGLATRGEEAPRGLVARTAWLAAVGTYRAGGLGHGSAGCFVPAVLRVLALDVEHPEGAPSPAGAAGAAGSPIAPAALHAGGRTLLARAKKMRLAGASPATVVRALVGMTAERPMVGTLGVLRQRARKWDDASAGGCSPATPAVAPFRYGGRVEGLSQSLARQFFCSFLAAMLAARMNRPLEPNQKRQQLQTPPFSSPGAATKSPRTAAVDDPPLVNIPPPKLPAASADAKTHAERREDQSRPNRGEPGRGLLRDMLAAARQRRRSSMGARRGPGHRHLGAGSPAPPCSDGQQQQQQRCSVAPAAGSGPKAKAASAGQLLEFLSPPPRRRDVVHSIGPSSATAAGWLSKTLPASGRPRNSGATSRDRPYLADNIRGRFGGYAHRGDQPAVEQRAFLRRRGGRLASDTARSSFDRVLASASSSSSSYYRGLSRPSGLAQVRSSFSSAEVLLAGSSSAIGAAAGTDVGAVAPSTSIGRTSAASMHESTITAARGPARWALAVLLDCIDAEQQHAEAKRDGRVQVAGAEQPHESPSPAHGSDGIVLDCVAVLLAIGGPFLAKAIRDAVLAISSALRPAAERCIRSQTSSMSSASAVSFAAAASLPAWIRDVSAMCGIAWTDVIGQAIGERRQLEQEEAEVQERHAGRPNGHRSHGVMPAALAPGSIGAIPVPGSAPPEGPVVRIVGRSPTGSGPPVLGEGSSGEHSSAPIDDGSSGTGGVGQPRARSEHSQAAAGRDASSRACRSPSPPPRHEGGSAVKTIQVSPLRSSMRFARTGGAASSATQGAVPPQPPQRRFADPRQRPGRRIRVSKWQPFATYKEG